MELSRRFRRAWSAAHRKQDKPERTALKEKTLRVEKGISAVIATKKMERIKRRNVGSSRLNIYVYIGASVRVSPYTLEGLQRHSADRSRGRTVEGVERERER